MQTVVKKISDFFVYVGMACLAGVMICASIDVFNRLAVGSSIAWAQQAASWLILFVIFTIAPVMVVEGGHISVFFLLDKLKGLARRIVENFNRISLIAYSSLALWGGLTYALYLARGGITRVFGIFRFPYYIIALCIPVGMFLILICGVYVLFTKFRQREEKGGGK